MNYEAYTAIARIAINWELAHDMLDNGIIIYHVPKDTGKGNAIVGEIRRAARNQGLKITVSWIDNWTIKVTWKNK
jgi:hypothetical protein